MIFMCVDWCWCVFDGCIWFGEDEFDVEVDEVSGVGVVDGVEYEW